MSGPLDAMMREAQFVGIMSDAREFPPDVLELLAGASLVSIVAASIGRKPVGLVEMPSTQADMMRAMLRAGRLHGFLDADGSATPSGVRWVESVRAVGRTIAAQMSGAAPALSPPSSVPVAEDAPRLSRALEWIERNHPDGIALVARALSES